MIYSDCPGLDSYHDRLFQLWEDQYYAIDEEVNESEEDDCDEE